MADINRTNLTGRLTRDSELRALPGGGTTLSFSIAVNDAVRNRDAGEWDERANYIDCVVFGSRALVASSHRRYFGRVARARAMATRCFWPPESCEG